MTFAPPADAASRLRTAAMSAAVAMLHAPGSRDDRSTVARGTALATAVSTVGILPAYLAGALGPQIRSDLGIGPAALGLGLSACFLSQSLFSARLGRMVDRLGALRSLRMAALATALVAATIAALTGSFAVLVVLLLATGTVDGLAPLAAHATGAATRLPQSAASATPPDSLPAPRRGGACGTRGAAKPMATLLCGFAVPI